LHHSGLVADCNHDVAFGKLCHNQRRIARHSTIAGIVEKERKFFGLNQLPDESAAYCVVAEQRRIQLQ